MSIFLSRAYLTTSQDPWVATAAAQLRRSIAMGRISRERAEEKLKRRMRRVLEQEIATAFTMD